jgi:subtilisin family serine protease
LVEIVCKQYKPFVQGAKMEFRHVKWTLVLAATVAGNLTACSPTSDLIKERQVTQAPKSAGDMGILLEGAKSEEINALLRAHPEAKVRTLNAPHGLYELFGISHAQIQQEFLGHSEPNQFFASQPRRPTTLSSPIGRGVKVGNLQPCQTSLHGPTAVLTVESPQNLNGSTIELGTRIRVNSTASHPSSGDTSTLQSVIVVASPEAALHSEIVENANTYEFTPDTLGYYKLATLVQDGAHACAEEDIEFVVTANRPYIGPTPSPLEVDLSQFTHLADVSAPQAWQITRGEGLVIAIVDTGVNYNHPLLAGHILVNPNEIPANGIDDDHNGFIDDYVGYDFVNQDPYPYDDDSHGTHVAGLAAGETFGIANGAKILPIKSLSPLGGDVGTIAAGIRYAVDRGANIINLSLGGDSKTPPEVEGNAIAYARSKGVLVITAAANGDARTLQGYDIEERPEYPACFSTTSDNVLTVAAYSHGTDLASYSNYGAHTVGVSTPGGMQPLEPIVSAAFENPRNEMFLWMVGTSMAAPIASGIAALVWSNHRELTYLDVKNILLNSGPDVPGLHGKIISGRHLDALAAVQSNSAQLASSLTSVSF